MKKNCPYCHTESPLYFQSKDYNRNITQEAFDHYLCPQCGLIFIAPIPPNLSAYYPEIYHSIPETPEYLEAASKQDWYKIEIVERYISKGRLLEIGPSYGGFTYLAKKAGFEVEAIEMNARCCRFLNEVVGVRAINSNDPVDALQHLEPYDAIALWHVIEHLPDPWSALDAIVAKLKPGGILVIASVNPEAFQFHIIGRRWLHLDAPRHVMLIPTKLLAEKLESLGMKIEMTTMADAGTIACNTGGWKFFFARTCAQRYTNKILLPILRPIMYLIGIAVSRLVSSIEQSKGRGSAYTMVFRKIAESDPSCSGKTTPASDHAGETGAA